MPGGNGRLNIIIKTKKNVKRNEWNDIMKKLSTDEFIAKATLIHGDKYDYTFVNYTGTYNIVCIKCPFHGKYYQPAHNHLIGRGCIYCAGNLQSNTKNFIEKSNAIHKNRYDYSKTKYVKNSKKVKIICKNHGEFLQTPSNHLRGNGCGICVKNIRSNTNEFINKAINIHQNKYNYSKVIYNGAHNKIIIICPKHGEFVQTPRNHLNGQTCPSCTYRISKPEKEFLDYCKITINNRQKYICGYNVDGYDPNTNTIYEFLGNYWHGNPKMFNFNDLNRHCKKTFGNLYNDTISKFNILKNNGYKVIYVWEQEWTLWNKTKNYNLPVINF